MKLITKFQCEICKAIWDSEEEAKLCEMGKIPKQRKYKIGDIVVLDVGHGETGMATIKDILIKLRSWTGPGAHEIAFKMEHEVYINGADDYYSVFSGKAIKRKAKPPTNPSSSPALPTDAELAG